jgi:ribonucleoside-diphosphate reductase beta chain
MLLTPRAVYSPFEYEWAYDYWFQQQTSHWLHTEISMQQDIEEWKHQLTDAERNVIGNILKGFTQSEVFIQEYWSQMVAKWFKKPEIQMMAAAFSAMESIHAVSYAYLNQSLGLEDFAAFLHEPSAKAKIDRLVGTKGKTKPEIARSLAIFSAFNEGVNLFSSFAILLNFSRFNKMKGLGQIIQFSIKDESLHSQAGCQLFNQLVQEYPEVLTDELKGEIYDAAKLTVELEDDFIDKAFELGPIQGISAKDVKAFIRYRTNTKLQDIGLKIKYTNIDKEALSNMEWFDVLSGGVGHGDFFAVRVSDYSKGTLNWDEIDFGEGIDQQVLKNIEEKEKMQRANPQSARNFEDSYLASGGGYNIPKTEEEIERITAEGNL